MQLVEFVVKRKNYELISLAKAELAYARFFRFFLFFKFFDK